VTHNDVTTGDIDAALEIAAAVLTGGRVVAAAG
jgi:hypothetical protein